MSQVNKRPVLILAPRLEPSALRVKMSVEKHGGEVLWLDSREEQPELYLHLDECGAFSGTVLGVPLHNIGSVFVRSIAPRQPRLKDAAMGEILDEKSWREGLVRGNALRDAHTLLLHALHEQGMPVFNPPRHGSVLEHKALQLQAAVELGLRVPETSLGTLGALLGGAGLLSLAQKEEPSKEDPSLQDRIWKPLRGGAFASATAEFSASQMLIEQPRIRGADVRLFCLRGTVVLSVEIPAGAWVDHRETSAFQEAKMRFTSCNVPISAAFLSPQTHKPTFVGLSKRLQLPFMALDFKRDSAGHLWFLEANGAPVFAEVDDDHDGKISEHLAAALLQKPQP